MKGERATLANRDAPFGKKHSPLPHRNFTDVRSPGLYFPRLSLPCFPLSPWEYSFTKRCSSSQVLLWCPRTCGQRVSPLARPPRRHILLAVRDRYSARPQNCAQDPPDACGTSDAGGMATGHHHLGGACPAGPDSPPCCRGHVDHGHCRRGRDRPPLCL